MTVWSSGVIGLKDRRTGSCSFPTDTTNFGRNSDKQPWLAPGYPCALALAPPQLSLGKILMVMKCPLVTHAKVRLVKRHFCKTTQISVMFCVSKY